MIPYSFNYKTRILKKKLENLIDNLEYKTKNFYSKFDIRRFFLKTVRQLVSMIHTLIQIYIFRHLKNVSYGRSRISIQLSFMFEQDVKPISWHFWTEFHQNDCLHNLIVCKLPPIIFKGCKNFLQPNTMKQSKFSCDISYDLSIIYLFDFQTVSSRNPQDGKCRRPEPVDRMCFGASWAHIFVFGQLKRIYEYGNTSHATLIKNS